MIEKRNSPEAVKSARGDSGEIDDAVDAAVGTFGKARRKTGAAEGGSGARTRDR